MFTDIEGSTALWEAHPSIMGRVIEEHDAIIREAADDHGGWVFATGGDGFAIAFASPVEAARAALDAQERLARTTWPGGVALSVRMGLHTGIAEKRDGDYFGPPVNEAARVMGVASGGQVAVSETTCNLLRHLTEDWGALEPLWSGRFKGITRRTDVFLLSPHGESAGRGRRPSKVVLVGISVLVLVAAGTALLGGREFGESTSTTDVNLSATTVPPSAEPVGAAPDGVSWTIDGVSPAVGEPVVIGGRVLWARTGGIGWVDGAGNVGGFDTPGIPNTAPRLIDGLVVLGVRGGLLLAIDPETGEEAARCVLELDVTVPPIAWDESMIVAAGDQSQIRRVRLGQDGCQTLAVNDTAIRGRVNTEMRRLGDALMAIDNLGRVYLVDGATLEADGAGAGIGRIPEPDPMSGVVGEMIRVAGAGGMSDRPVVLAADRDGFLFSIDIDERVVSNTGIRIEGEVLLAADGDLLAVVIDEGIRRRLQRIDTVGYVALDASDTELGDIAVGPVRGSQHLYLSDGPRVIAFDAETLDRAWEVPLDSTPAFIAELAGQVVVLTVGGEMKALPAPVR